MTQAGGTQTIAAPIESSSRRRRNGIIAIVSAVLWVGLIFFVWANRGMDDSVPTGEIEVIDKRLGVTTRVFTTQVVKCNGLFADPAVAEPLIALEPPRTYTRPPCELLRSEGRLVFSINVAMAGLVIAAGAAAVAMKDASDVDGVDDLAAAKS